MLVEEPFSLTLTCSMIAYGLLWQLMSEAQELMSGLFLPRDTYLTIMGISMMASQRHVKNNWLYPGNATLKKHSLPKVPKAGETRNKQWQNKHQIWNHRPTKNYKRGIDLEWSVGKLQGPVVQSVVSLTSSLRVISLTVCADSIYNILIFFSKKMWVAFALQKLLTFFQQKFSIYLRITRCKF